MAAPSPASPTEAERRDAKRKAVRLRLLTDFEYYAGRCLKIRTKDARIIPFVMNRAQRRFLDAILEQWQRTGRVRIITLKARQLGLSTLWGGFMYWWISQHRATKGIVVTHKGDATAALFDMTKRYHSEMEPSMRPHTSRSSGKELKFDFLDSGYMIATAGADTVGRGDTLQLAHLSEAGLWPKSKAAEIGNGLLQAVPNVPDTFVCIESTARGKSGWFYQQYLAATTGDEATGSGYEVVFLPWFFADEYSEPAPASFERTPDEDDLVLLVLEEFNEDLTDDQLFWRRQKIAQDGLDLFKQEYPTTAEEAFLTSGAPVFNPTYLEYDPITKTFEPSVRGRLWLYHEVDPSTEYTIGADVSNSVGREERRDGEGTLIATGEGDYSVAIVLDKDKRLVAKFRGKVEPYYYADILFALGTLYNTARLAIEFNNHGILPNTRLYKDLGYQNLYTREVYDRKTEETKQELGFYTDVKTRPLIIDELRQAIRAREIELNDRDVLRELGTFIANPDNGKIEADLGCHDDCVMALAIANHIHEGCWTLLESSDDLYFDMI
jgi:hypothetical protein